MDMGVGKSVNIWACICWRLWNKKGFVGIRIHIVVALSRNNSTAVLLHGKVPLRWFLPASGTVVVLFVLV